MFFAPLLEERGLVVILSMLWNTGSTFHTRKELKWPGDCGSQANISVSRSMRLTEYNPHQAGGKRKTAVEIFLLPTKLHFLFFFFHLPKIYSLLVEYFSSQV